MPTQDEIQKAQDVMKAVQDELDAKKKEFERRLSELLDEFGVDLLPQAEPVKTFLMYKFREETPNT